MEIAVVVGGRAYVRNDVGFGTSEDAEWLALIEALRIAQRLGLTDFVLLGDAAAVVAKAGGTMKLRGSAVRHMEVVRALAPTGQLHVRQIKRSQNLAGIALARLHPR